MHGGAVMATGADDEGPMMDLELDLQIASEETDDLPGEADLHRWARAALEGRRTQAALNIRIVDEAEGRAMNLHYRGKDRPTNVLSFPFEVPVGLTPDDVGNLIGDLVICAPVVRREAAEQGKTAAAHWAHMVVHGVLHLLGFDHVEEEQASEMESLETAILGGLGFPPPYTEDPSHP